MKNFNSLFIFHYSLFIFHYKKEAVSKFIDSFNSFLRQPLFLLNLNHSNKNLPTFRLNRIRFQTTTTVIIQTLARTKGEILFMKWASHFGFIALRAYHAARDSHLLPMRTHILGSKPFAASGEIKNSNLFTIE